MKNILILGAGKSSSALIKQLLADATTEDWKLTIGDQFPDNAKQLFPASEKLFIREFNASDSALTQQLVSESDLVISMLPALLHPKVASVCLETGKDLITASYVSDEMKKLDAEVKRKGLLFLNEMGVDPGIDHMSAMQVIDRIRAQGGKMTAFESFTGGLLAPESEKDNPWKYKFTWNPRNVVLAGQGIVKFRQEGTFKYIPYHRLFRRTEMIQIPSYGYFEGYANRDSLKYLDSYNLQEVKTIYRGTLRRPGYCRTWNAFVQIGATDDSYTMEDTETMTYREFINSFLYYDAVAPVELKLAYYMNWDIDSEEMHRMKWLGVFEDKKVGLKNATPAQILQKMLEDKWTLDPDDKDMLVMWHKFNYEMNGKSCESHAYFVVTGDDRVNTAMAKTVGLPVAISAKMLLQKKINLQGVVIPTVKEVYVPVMRELEKFGMRFEEREIK
ncbi:MAG: saccharopine dehydrogenase C-terminal domain-containing protein [Chitinophagales bacterium]|nr:saccharopine dehydrogenase C-terminal domain-containing protein [Chitinophagales bacterium]